MSISKPKAILFDWDNTLVDTWPTIHEALNQTLRYMEHPEWSLEKTKANVKQSMRDAFPEMFGDRWEEAAGFYQKSYRAIHLQHLHPLPLALDVVAMLRDSSAFVGVVSNKMGTTLRTEIENLGWSEYFDAIVGAGDAAKDKPNGEPAHLALSESGMQAGEHVWFIGDTIVDLECAHNTGCTPVLYGDFVTGANEYEGFTFAHHVRDHTELLALLKSVF